MLPRPARLLRQHGLLTAVHTPSHRLSTSTFPTCTSKLSVNRHRKSNTHTYDTTNLFTLYGGVRHASSSSGAAHVVRRAASPELDDSFKELIKDGMGMGMGTGTGVGSTSSTSTTPAGGGRGKGRMTTQRGFGNHSLPDIELAEPQSSSSSSGGMKPTHHFGLIIDEPPTNSGEGEGGDGSAYKREERRSPAVVLGSKRLGVVVLPEEMKRGIQRQIDEHEDPRQIRLSYLNLPASSPRARDRETKHDHRSGKPRKTLEGELAKAAGVLPGQYGVVRNVMEEMERRFGTGWLGDGEVVEFSGGLGPGVWATMDAMGALPSSGEEASGGKLNIQLVHSSRHGLDLAKKISEAVPESAVDLQFSRKYTFTGHEPSLVLSTFQLSLLPTQPSQQTHLLDLLALESPYLVLVDRSTPEGWAAISRARAFILEQSTSESPLHVIAPCPHDGVCPLASTDDICGFSQRLQRPSFVRKTKHSSRGEEDTGYCYLIIGRGERPAVSSSDQLHVEELSRAGRMGGVGKEEAEKAMLKLEGRSVIREIEGHEAILEVVSLHEPQGDEEGVARSQNVDKEAMEENLRKEAYAWPRMVAPPMKRSGHVTMDACCPDGNIQRLTFSKSHSKQGYHDARKSSWGDLFPHESKTTPVTRTRGVRRLRKAEKEQDEGALVQEILAAGMEEELEMEADLLAGRGDLEELERLGIKLPKAELVSGGGDDVTVWKSGEKGPFGKDRQRREFSTVSGQRPLSLAAGRSNTRPQARHMSVRPQGRTAKVTLATLNAMSASKTPITVLTAYDYPTALLSETCGVDMVLVGDSLSQVALGHDSTTSITLDEMIHHAKAVTRGAKSAFVFADMPMGSFEVSLEQGVSNVLRMIKEGGVDGVKIEGGLEILPLVKRLSEIGIPVMPHLGLQPQRATSLSGYLVQGRAAKGALEIMETAKKMREAGAFAVLLEAVPSGVARVITEKVEGILTIGIGAGKDTSGQVLVITDVLGVYEEDVESISTQELDSTTSLASALVSAGTGTPRKPPTAPRFVRQFGSIGQESRRAIRAYIQAVKEGTFPDNKESYGMKKDEWEKFLEMVNALE
ncbi:3-methyl-2-oxobutanoate hydroxymethyltransferase [Kwoniella shandongensis]|uniref:3-methyl-2-oxobutanoate hydroxymethyltransferase n=1 Tax=Kwoniella shandongensis TaxID=1734106 RepID=A0A5M6BY03_9TREE|nr:3-methyl-2-oxobutanoate hydroxymethyltransferase [Kwoniella shandongensis]KAA5527727.1 3-methyl-2-oxobutanoate hydroxymethyltransferase [Kwoniella shandongensis]